MNDLVKGSPRKGVTQTLRSATRFCRFFVQNYPLLAYARYLGHRPLVRGRVSVITPTYNRPTRLAEAIESVRAQTFQQWEHIIVSDGRDNRVPALVAQFGDPRIRSYHTYRLPLKGNYQRNYGLARATGEFVLYLDDDNVIYPNCLRTMVAGFTSDDVGFVVCPIHYGNGVKRQTTSLKFREIDLLNYMVRRRLVEQAWGQSVHGAADYFLIVRVAKTSRGCFLDEVIGHHR